MSSLLDEKINIICFSNQLWDFENWTNKKHVMYRMAALGNNVLFVDPPINTGNVFLTQIKRGLWNLKRFLMRLKFDDTGVIVYTPLNFVPFTSITAAMHVSQINKLSKKYLDKNLKTVVWIYNVEIPQLKKYVEGLKYDFLIYDCVDNYTGFPQYNTPEKQRALKQTEEYLSKKSDMIFATTPGLAEKLRKYNENTYFTPNVGDYERFKDTKKFKYQLPEDLKKIPEPRIGFIGALDEYKFDKELVRKIAKDHPDYSFVLIGPMALKDKDADIGTLGLDGFDNIHYLGPKPYAEKIYYMAGFDVEIIPYVLNDYTVGGCFPVKFHDSLSAGIPVVVTDLPAYSPFKDECYIAKSYQEFSDDLTLAMKEDSFKKIKERQKVAKENSWDGKVNTMLKLVLKGLRKK